MYHQNPHDEWLRKTWEWIAQKGGAFTILLAAGLLYFKPELRTQVARNVRGIFYEVRQLLEIGDRWARRTLRIVLFSPFLFLVMALFLSREHSLEWIPFVAIISLIAVLHLYTRRPSFTGAVMLAPLGRQVITWLLGLVGVSFVVSMLIAAVPLANDRHLIPVFFLCLFALILPIGNFIGRTAGSVVKMCLAIFLVTLIVIFALGGRTEARAKCTSAWPSIKASIVQWHEKREKAKEASAQPASPNPTKPEPGPPPPNPYPNYNPDPNAVSKDVVDADERGTNNHENDNGSKRFSVVLVGDGEFGKEGHVRPPHSCHFWRKDWESDEPNRHVGFRQELANGTVRSVGPFGPNDLPGPNDPRFNGWILREWMVQGEGTLVYTCIS